MASQREQSAMKYMQLQSELTAAGKSTAANLHARTQKQDEPVRQTGSISNSNNAEMQKLHAEVEHLKRMLLDTQEDNDQLRQLKSAETESKRRMREECDREVQELNKKLDAAKLKRKDLAEKRNKETEDLRKKIDE